MADTTPTLREAAQQALEALESLQGGCTDSGDGATEAITVWCPEVITALRAALAEQAAEQAVIPPAFAHAASQQMAVTSEWCRGWDACRAHILSAAPAAEQAEPVAVPAGYALMRTPITEEMHVAAAKVLVRANGLDGTPQRMLDAMIAAAPPAPARQEPLTEEQITEACRGIFLSDYRSAREYDFAIARAIERAHGITAAPAEGGAA